MRSVWELNRWKMPNGFILIPVEAPMRMRPGGQGSLPRIVS